MLTQSDEEGGHADIAYKIKIKYIHKEFTKILHRCGVRDIIGHGAYARRRKRWEKISCSFLHSAIRLFDNEWFIFQVCAPGLSLEGYRFDIQGDKVPNHN